MLEETNGHDEAQAPIPTEEHDRAVKPVDSEEPPRLKFPVVAIGASAGGLEAYSAFFKIMSVKSGMAFVLIQHLPPDRESMIAEILARRTSMPVLQVVDGMPVEPNHVYIIRPGHTLFIKNGLLKLGERLSKPGHNRPVDDFFRSLAEEQRERAICIVMSGMGSNGAAGAQAIKAVGGLCIAQDPETAQFPSMPRHLIDAGYADYVLRIEDMPEVLSAYSAAAYTNRARDNQRQLDARDQQHVREILAILKTRNRQDFSGYKKPTVFRRIQRRMGLNRVNNLADYAKLLRQSPVEVVGLSDDILIHVTGFFRDPDTWEALQERVLTPLVQARDAGGSIRCWVTACASGEEAYSLAMLLSETCERVNKKLDIKIFATDMAERTLQNARQGIYPGGIESEISPERLERFFTRDDAMYRVRPELRETVVFAPQNVLQDPPFSRLDIISCRNLLIYLEPEVQQRLLQLLHFGLREGGTLFLGTSETAAGHEDLFQTIDKKSRIFRRVGPTRHGATLFPLPHAIPPLNPDRLIDRRTEAPRKSLLQLTTRTLLEHHTPAAVTIDRDGRILYFHGNTEPFLTQPRGEATRDLLAMTRESIRGAVRTAIQRANRDGATVTVPDGWVQIEPDRRARVAITVSPLDVRLAPDCLVVSFHEHGEDPHTESNNVPKNATLERSEEELRRIRDELQSTVEELQTSNEELKASHEEVVSINEELQSTNEELETSREEMQSLNEELTTVNSQLHAKMEEHQAASNDLAGLLASTDIAVLFLDLRFNIRRFTPPLRELLDVINSDLGRPVQDLARKFQDPDLMKDAADVLERLTPSIREISADGDRWFLRRITPYRTIDNRIDGVVITFVDITHRRKTEEALRQNELKYRALIESSSQGLFQMGPDWSELRHVEGGGFLADMNEPSTEWMQTCIPPEDHELMRKHIDEAIRKKKLFELEHRVRRHDGSIGWALSRAVPMLDAQNNIGEWFGSATDVTRRKLAEEALRESEMRLSQLLALLPTAVYTCDASANITFFNRRASELWNATPRLGISDTSKGMGFRWLWSDGSEWTAENNPMLVAIRNGSPTRNLEAIIERADGSRVDVSINIDPLNDGDGKGIGAINVFEEISERKRAQEALVSSEEKSQAARLTAEAANQMKDQFLATLSHELRTPLSAILLWSKMLQSRTVTADRLADGLAAIQHSAEAQKTLIEDLLDVSRIASGKLRLQFQNVELVSVVRGAIDSILPTAATKHIEVVSDLAKGVGVVRADPDRLRQIIWNLLTNGVKFTQAGGKIHVELWRHDDTVEIRVTDNGRGIAADFLPRVFEPFRQVESISTRTHGGIGLGLAIVKQLVELHGGTVEVASDGLGKGATFTVQLPLPKLRKTTTTKPLSPSIATAEAMLQGRSVLLIEDDSDTRRGLTLLIESAGAEVREAANAAEAFDFYVAQRPDLIVSDIGLPEENGCQLIRRIREREENENVLPVPAVALSAFARDQDRRESTEAGFNLHLAKPVYTEALIGLLHGMLNGE